MGDVKDLAQKSIDALRVPNEVKIVLRDIQADLSGAYRDSFMEMVRALNEQASALRRIQSTLAIIVQHIAPTFKNEALPIGIKAVDSQEDADLATAIVVADPIGAGYSLNQTTLAEAIGISQPDVSILVKGLQINEDGECAVEVRKGKTRSIFNYHNPRAVVRLRELIAKPPSGIDEKTKLAIERSRQRLLSLPARPPPVE